MIMGCEKNTMMSYYITNTQLDTIIHSKILTDIQEENKAKQGQAFKKSMNKLLQDYAYTKKEIAFIR